ncbi:MAG TPA: LytTR family DNA-binding domain-containing protein [Vicinamibacterales bacterium]|jgi:two-component system LytT family response regulator
MIRAFIVDDEPLAVKRLSRLLEETDRVQIVGASIDPEEALTALNRQPVDVLFLDVQMPGLTGFELLEQLKQPPAVVFTTAYDAYALNAFEANAVDYLLKPVEVDRLVRALDKVERLGGTPQGDVRALARELAAQLSPNRKLERIASRVGERTTLLDVARVSHFVAKDKLTFAVTASREHAIDYTLAQLEDLLDRRRYVRIHRSTIVNASYVQELYPSVDGGMLVRLKDEAKTELSVARDRVKELKQRLGI